MLSRHCWAHLQPQIQEGGDPHHIPCLEGVVAQALGCLVVQEGHHLQISGDPLKFVHAFRGYIRLKITASFRQHKQ